MVRRAEDLCRHEQQLEQKESAAQAARVTKQAAWRRMGGLGEAPAHALEPHVVDRAERVVQRQIAVRARVTEMRRRLAALGGAAARALSDYEQDAEKLAKQAMAIAAEVCVFTNDRLTIETIEG